jgi:hypothetical protein
MKQNWFENLTMTVKSGRRKRERKRERKKEREREREATYMLTNA